MTTPKSGPAPVKAPLPDLSWFSCICCGRRPVPCASFSMLLTTCSHIVCSSCWSRRGSGECPKCGVKANTLNLSAAKQLPKQLEPYYKSPLEHIKKLLRVCEFQEHQKRQMLERRKVAWVLINHKSAKEDFDKEYAECKQLLATLNKRKRALRQVADNLRRKGIDPIQILSCVVSANVINSTLGVPPSPAGISAPSTPFFPTPLARPPSTSTPAYRHGVNPPNVEFVEPKRLPHTMRGSVTSKAARRSPSIPPTPLTFQQGLASNPGSILPVKRPRSCSYPSSNYTQPVADHQPMEIGQPVMMQSSSQYVVGNDRQLGQPIQQPIIRPVMQSNPIYQSRQPIAQFNQSMVNSGQPIAQYSQPVLHSGQRVQQLGPMYQIQSVRPIIPPRRPILQSSNPQHTPRSSNMYTPPSHNRVGGSGTSSVRIRALPQSSASQRIFPSPTPSQQSHPHTITPSHVSQRPTIPTGIERVSLRPTPPSHSHSMTSCSPRGHVRTPTNPSPLLKSFAPQSSSPWKQQMQRSAGSPWRPGHTPPPGTRLSGSGRRRSSGPRLTPMKS